MKKYFYLGIIFFFLVNCFSQNINIAFHRYFETPGQFVKINNKLFFSSISDTAGFIAPCYIYGISGNTTLFRNNVFINEATVINDMLVTSRKEIAFVGSSHGCDAPGSPFGGPSLFLSKIDTSGNTIFYTNMLDSSFSITTGFKKIVEYTDSSFFTVTDNMLYHFNKNGIFLSKKATPVNGISAICIKNNHILLSSSITSSTITTTNQLTEIDTACNLITQNTSPCSFNKLSYINSNLIIGISSSGIIYKIDFSLSVTSNSQSTQGTYTLTDFSLSHDTIYCSAYNTSNEFSVFKIDTSFMNTNLLATGYVSTIPAKIISDNSSLYFLNIEDSLNSHNPNISILEMNKTTRLMDNKGDAGVINAVLDSGYVHINTVQSSIPGNPPVNYFNYYYKMKVTVKNYGPNTIHGLYINNKPYYQINCGSWYYTQYFSGLNIAPNQTITLTTPFIEYQGPTTFGPAPTSSYPVSINNVCFWTSAPNKRSDANHSNDNYCSGISFLATVGIKEVLENNIVTCYPNPFDEKIELIANNNIISAIEICFIDGKMIKQVNQLNTQKTTVSLPDLVSGFYFAKVYLKDGKCQIFKIVKD